MQNVAFQHSSLANMLQLPLSRTIIFPCSYFSHSYFSHFYVYLHRRITHTQGKPGLLFHSSNWWRSIGNRSQTSTFQEGDRKCRESWSTPITKWSEKIWSSDEAGWRGPTASLSSLEPSGGATVVVSWHKEPHCQCRATPLCHTPPSEPPSSCTGTPPHTWCKTRSAAPGHCSLANSTSDDTQLKISSPADLELAKSRLVSGKEIWKKFNILVTFM